jgi:hypothetical protein
MSLEADGVRSRVEVVLGSADRPLLVHWSTQHPQVYSPFDSYALRAPDGWVLIDPELPDGPVQERLRELIRERPVATVLTNDGHERACYTARERWGIPVWGPVVPEGASDRGVGYDGTPDHMYEEQTSLPGGLRAVKVAALWGGEHALFWRAPGGESVLFSGDLLNGQAQPELAKEDHFRRGPGLEFGSRPGYLERHPDRPALRASLDRLLAERIDLICGAHAIPFGDDPAGAIRRMRERV